ncbi:T9SS type A sorting domain-containing protein [Hymenobacter cellulosilyticus]|uniref:T9SS type A sorting domain-containing protein n=1 Tax=Hymenobacter cellulosilyticus TaxID=2932248 RepID=A0A8T9Q5X3_9BACT|nr:T9SS type A sorting domain-containing protein [Hymenobacter cellulosilyticus]UOQ71378.1 T9SS type A sorting domain-containing protein [Hymenobacter cellulosilyticus]
MEGNTALAICSMPWVCSYLGRGGLAYFAQNAPGCATNAAVQQGCQVLSTPEPAAQLAAAYPNPVSEVLYLRVAARFQVCDLLGRVLLQGEGASIPVATLPQGLYLVQTGPELKSSFRISKR